MKCEECDGTGTMDSFAPNGKSRCSDCLGTGKVDIDGDIVYCGVCDGLGEMAQSSVYKKGDN